MSSSNIVLNGTVIEKLPGLKYLVKVEDQLFGDMIVNAYMSGKMVKNFINVIIGDRVSVEVSPYDLKNGRIVRRESLNKPIPQTVLRDFQEEEKENE